MKRVTTNLAFWLAAAGFSSFWIVYGVLGHEATVEIASGLVFGADIMLALTWAAAAYYAVRHGAKSGEGILALGLFWVCSFGAIQRFWTIVFRWLDRPDWMLDHWSNPLAVWSIFWGLIIIMLAPGTQQGNVPARNQVQVILAVFIGALVAGITIGLSLA